MYREIPLKSSDRNLAYSNVVMGINLESLFDKFHGRTCFSVNLENLNNEELCYMYQQGNTEALDFILNNNKKLIYSRVSRYSNLYNNNLDFEDLVQDGYMGLLKATEKFDINMNTKFSTYSTWWIDKEILKSIFDSGFLIRIPCHKFEDIQRVWRVIKDMSKVTDGDIKTVALRYGIAKTKVEDIIRIINTLLNVVSLNKVISVEDDTEFLNLIPDSSDKTVESIIDKKELSKALCDVLSVLPEREQKIVKLRYGLEDEIPRTLEEIGLIVGVSKERIRQLEIKILKKLRTPACLNILKEFR